MDLIVEPEGLIAFGWAEPNVYFTRLVGELSAHLGAAYVRALRQAVESATLLRYFVDSRALTSYDLDTRNEFFQVLRINREKFLEIVILKWAGELSRSDRLRLEAVGEPLAVTDDRAEFERLLALATPRYAEVLRALRDMAVLL